MNTFENFDIPNAFIALTRTSYTVSLSKFLSVYEENDVREAFGTSTGIMDWDQSEGEDMEEEGALKITPVWKKMKSISLN